MVHKKILFVMLFVYVNTTQAQSISNKYLVNFKVDEYIIDDSDKRVLDGIITEAKTANYCELTLSAHTDNDANDAYNMNLSKRRAQSVYGYLTANGMNEKVVDINWFGERKPSMQNMTDEGKAYNRRVEIELRKYQINSLSDIYNIIGEDYTQTFTLDAAKTNTIVGRDGTQIIIPMDAFETAKGKPVANDKVTIELQEFQKPMDALLNKLSTVCDGKILESGGMFNIVATYNGEELKLRSGKELPVEMPSKNMKPDMQLFSGVKTKDNIIEWKEVKKPFAPKPKKNIVSKPIKLDVTYLKTLIQKKDYEATELQYKFKLPNCPQKPRKPRYPKKAVMPTEEELFSEFERKVYSKHRRDKIIEREKIARQELYNNKVVNYERRLARYNIDSAKFVHDSTIYENEFDNFYEWVSLEIIKQQHKIEQIEKQIFNSFLRILIAQSESNKLVDPNSQKYLYYGVGHNTSQVLEVNGILNTINLLNWLYTRTSAELYELCSGNQLNYNSLKVISIFQANRRHRSDNVNTWTYNTFAATLLANDTNLQRVFAFGKRDIINSGPIMKPAFNLDAVTNIYTTKLSTLGMINCDRFSAVQAKDMVTIKVQANPGANVCVYIKNISSIMNYFTDSEGSAIISIPKDLQLSILVLELNNGQPSFQKMEYTTQKHDTILAQTTPITLKEMHRALRYM